MYFKSVLVKFEDGWPWPIFEVTGVNLNMKIISAYKHDNTTNNNRIGPKLIPWMYFKSVLVKFEDGWPWPIFEVTGVNLNMKIISACKHDNTTNNNRIGPKLIPWMYFKSVLVKFEDGWPWPIFEVTGVNLNMKIYNFRL